VNTGEVIRFFEVAKLMEAQNITILPEMTRVILSDLRAQQEQQNPQPLTLEELKERAGKPVYIVSVRYGHGEWYVLGTPATDDYGNIETTDNDTRYHGDYGKTWFAYAHEPTEVYLTREEFMKEFMFDTETSVHQHAKKGMPRVKINGIIMYPRYACQRWFAGEK